MTQETREWFEKAALDLSVAKHLKNTYHPTPNEIICYHCQQSAEKAIKALIVFFGSEGGLPKLHDLSFLLGQLKNKVKIDDRYYDYADTLSPYGVAVRYPNELFLEERHAAEALRYADEILQWAESVIEAQKGETR
jgi:HEPN domain-containing protein